MCKRTMILAFALLAVIPLLGACHTTAGAGEDISKTGQAIEKGADKLTPHSP
jgi:predicted small secreted protein